MKVETLTHKQWEALPGFVYQGKEYKRKAGRLYVNSEYGVRAVHTAAELMAQSSSILSACHTVHERIMAKTLMDSEIRKAELLYKMN